MYVLRSIHEITNTIAVARGLLTAMFEKRKSLSFRYADALALLKDDENRLKLLLEKEQDEAGSCILLSKYRKN